IHVTPVAVVGDLDSLENRKDGLNYVVFPKEKDETDGQLALDYAKSAGYDAVTIYGATGGDIGQILGNIGLLKYAKDIKIDARISGVGFDIKLLEGKVSDTAFEGQKISLFPFFGDALVTNSRGLYYPLENLLLSAGTNRGLSNVATANEISFTVESGILLIIKYY
ncbi:MAG: thiamine diphosphokinase, partial [Eubacteriales bacterium]|nr:thiamine diphosphokinase [Eubacteriales bacterium]